jgi:hypothetical protein
VAKSGILLWRKLDHFESKFEYCGREEVDHANCAAAREGWPAWRFATDFWAAFRAGAWASPMTSRACHGVGCVKLDDRRTDPHGRRKSRGESRRIDSTMTSPFRPLIYPIPNKYGR